MTLSAGYLSAIVLLIALGFYLYAITKGRVTSNRVTWGVWVLVNALFCFSYYESVGLVSSIYTPLVYLLGTAAIFFSLLVFGKKGHWSPIDRVCLIGVIFVFLLWLIFKSPIATLTYTMLIDILGAVPLVFALRKDPAIDYGPAWLLGFVANIINLMAIEKWNYANASYPVYLVLLTLTMTTLIYVPGIIAKIKPVKKLS